MARSLKVVPEIPVKSKGRFVVNHFILCSLPYAGADVHHHLDETKSLTSRFLLGELRSRFPQRAYGVFWFQLPLPAPLLLGRLTKLGRQ